MDFRNRINQQITTMHMSKEHKSQLANFALQASAELERVLAQTFATVDARTGVQTRNTSVIDVCPSPLTVKCPIQCPSKLVDTLLKAATAKQVGHACGFAVRFIQHPKDMRVIAIIDVPFDIPCPNYAQLLKNNLLPAERVMFGYANGLPVYDQFSNLYNVAITGTSQMGKTSTLRFLMAQLAAHGAQFAVIDPQGNEPTKSLAHTIAGLPLVAPVAIERHQWLRIFEYVNAVGLRRSQGDKDRTPLILVIDEANSLFDDKEINERLADLMAQITRAYSKCAVNIWCVAHSWRAKDVGGSTRIREMFQSRYVHRCDDETCKMMIGSEYVDTAKNQVRGHAIMRNAIGETRRLIIPETTPADMKKLGSAGSAECRTLSWSSFTARDGVRNPTSTTSRPSVQPSMSAKSDTSEPIADGIPQPLPPAEIIRLFTLDGWGVGEIAKHMNGGSSGGRGYQLAAQHVNATLRQELTRHAQH